MSLLSYITNFDELIANFKDSINLEIDTSNLENLLNKFFPELLDLLKKLLGTSAGTQKIKGFATIEDPIIFSPEKDVLITGLTFSQDIFDRAGFDKWKVEIVNGDESIVVMEDIYSKDTLQHKHFEAFYPIPAGYKIVVTISKSNNVEKVYWVDIEYIVFDFSQTEDKMAE